MTPLHRARPVPSSASADATASECGRTLRDWPLRPCGSSYSRCDGNKQYKKNSTFLGPKCGRTSRLPKVVASLARENARISLLG